MLLTQLLSVLCDPVDHSPPGSSVLGIFQARILELIAISSSRGSSRLRDRICVSCIGRQILYSWATWEALSRGRGAANSLWTSECVPPGLTISEAGATSQEKDRETGTENELGWARLWGRLHTPRVGGREHVWGEHRWAAGVCEEGLRGRQPEPRGGGGVGGAWLTLLGTVRLQRPTPAGCGSFCKWVLPAPEKAPSVRVVCRLSSSLHLFLPSCLEHCPPCAGEETEAQFRGQSKASWLVRGENRIESNLSHSQIDYPIFH